MSRKREYLEESDSVLLQRAIEIRPINAKEFVRKDSVLYTVMRERKLTEQLWSALGQEPRNRMYEAMPDEALYIYAIAASQAVQATAFKDVGDSVLCRELVKRGLTAKLASYLGFRRRGRSSAPHARADATPAVETLLAKYSSASDHDLFQIVKTHRVKKPAELQKIDSVLYAEVLKRGALRDRLTTELGWRRAVRQWSNLTLEEWLEICAEFDSPTSFRTGYVAAYNAALRLEIWPEIHCAMAVSGKWGTLYGLDGRAYDSRSEMIVANWLYLSEVSYTPHPLLPWADSRRRREADIGLSEDRVIEVFLCSEEGLARRNDHPAWIEEYVVKRRAKLNEALKHGIQMIAIEAEVYRYEGYEAFLDHVRTTLDAYGIHLTDPCRIRTRLDVSSTARGLKWTIEEFTAYAKKNKLIQLSDFMKPEHNDLYQILAQHRLRDDLRAALDQIHGRKTEAEGKFLISEADLRKWCLTNKVLRREEYNKAYNEGRTPFGAPASVRQSYGVNFTKFITGRERSEFWPWEKARAHVRARKFRNKDDFYRAVRLEPEMQFIRKSPSAPTGGYPEFTDWLDFLGKES